MSAASLLIDSKPSKGLHKFFRSHCEDDILAVADSKLGNAIKEKLQIECVHNNVVMELMRGVRSQLTELISGLASQDLAPMSFGLSHSLSIYRQKEINKNVKSTPDPTMQNVHYVGTLLDGIQFDSSRDRGTPFKFKLGQVKYEARLEDGTLVSKSDGVEFTVNDGYFCHALSKAVNNEKGRKSLLDCKPQYGFGENGREATGDECDMPPNATIHINLELVSWKTVSEITSDKKVLKKILKEGEGYEKPNDGAIVQVNLIGKLQDGTVFVIKGYDEEPPFEFKVDEVSEITSDKKVLKKILKEGEGYEKPNDGAIVQVNLIGKLQDGTVFVIKGYDEEPPFEFKVDEEQVIEDGETHNTGLRASQRRSPHCTEKRFPHIADTCALRKKIPSLHGDWMLWRKQ
ncbi:unnamed protein product [Fraxinus pennsylvanica]|uniref:peptidylprolyl isomerase n=1 Tax=Fraxinus pennsylvanica TaxID=56036 RepID=A0AAD1ZPY6_9LAMI|nr:unnamed protein product [Fraxinus pennsylvanica]